MGEIAGGVGTSGQTIKYATMQKTGRASYIAVNPTNGAIAAWLNGCADLGATNGRNVVQIMLKQSIDGVDTKYTWEVFDSTIAMPVELCNTTPLKTSDAGNADIDDPSFPPSIGTFTSHGNEGCKYTGSSTAPGTLSCPGKVDAVCEKDVNFGDEAQCGDSTVAPVVMCRY
jgi:hypothetical protein